MYTRTVIQPAVEPVSLAEVKKHLRLAITTDDAVEYTVEDDKLSMAIAAARILAEVHTRSALISRTVEVVLSGFPSGFNIVLPDVPVKSVESVSYVDPTGNHATFTDYDVDILADELLLKPGFSWPQIQKNSRVVVRYVCGYGDTAESVPASIRQAILLLVGNFYENPEAVIVGQRVSAINLPIGVDALLSGHRRYEF